MASTGTHDTPGRFPAGARAFPHRDLTGIAQLERHEILFLLAEAERWVEFNRQPEKHCDELAGLTIINAFFENSTRTLLSFEIAGKRLGADHEAGLAIGPQSRDRADYAGLIDLDRRQRRAGCDSVRPRRCAA